MLKKLSADPQLLFTKVENLAMNYLEKAVSTGFAHKIIKLSLQHLITSVMFSRLCMISADVVLLERRSRCIRKKVA